MHSPLLRVMTNLCALTNVMLVSRLVYNLFSVPRASEAGGTTEFGPTMCSVRMKGQVVAQESKQAGLYILHQLGSPERAYLASVETWHRRFGHLGRQNLDRLKAQCMVDEMAIGDEPTQIHVWRADNTRIHFQREPSSWSTVMFAGRLEHSCWAAPTILSRLWTDDPITCGYTLRSKDQVFDTFLQWQRMV
jgi:hypothetical protein